MSNDMRELKKAAIVAQWQKRHADFLGGSWQNTDEFDAKWWRNHSKDWQIRALYDAPQPAIAPDAQPVMEFQGQRHCPEGTREVWGWLADGATAPPKGTVLYAEPQPATAPELVKLTDAEITKLMYDTSTLPECEPNDDEMLSFARAIEAASHRKQAAKCLT